MVSPRDKKIDILKGILIIFVVMGHHKEDIIHDVIFLFHMPLFFLISGLTIKENVSLYDFLKNKVAKMLIPYFVYMCVDIFIVNRQFSINVLKKMFWGGRALPGVYWYTTCYLGTVFLFYLYQKVPTKLRYLLIALGGLVAVAESNLISRYPKLLIPGVPFSLDTSLIALLYLYLGFCFKEKIIVRLHKPDKLTTILFIPFLLALAAFVYFDFFNGTVLFEIDMKQVEYKELLLSISVPLLFLIVLVKIVEVIDNKILSDFLAIVGQTTLPIMYMHRLLADRIINILDNKVVYTLVGVLIPLLLSYILGRFKISRLLFGFTEIKRLMIRKEI